MTDLATRIEARPSMLQSGFIMLGVFVTSAFVIHLLCDLIGAEEWADERGGGLSLVIAVWALWEFRYEPIAAALRASDGEGV